MTRLCGCWVEAPRCFETPDGNLALGMRQLNGKLFTPRVLQERQKRDRKIAEAIGKYGRRIACAGAVYRIVSRGNELTAVFRADQDRINFPNTLRHVNKRCNGTPWGHIFTVDCSADHEYPAVRSLS